MPYRFSPSSLRILKECPRCFWLQFKKNIKRPSTPFPSLPSGMDKILKVQFDTFRELNLLPPVLKGIDNGTKLFPDKELMNKWRNNFRGIRWADEEGNIFMGAVDELLQNGKTIIVLDYKTRGYPLKENTHTYYEDQLSIYNFLLRKNGYKTEDYSYLLFYHPEKVNNIGEVVFNTDLVKVKINVNKAENIFKQALDVLSKDMPDSSETCEFCRWTRQNSF